MNTETGEVEDKKYRIKDTDTKDFWMSILKDKTFREFVENKYQVASGNIMEEDTENIFAEA